MSDRLLVGEGVDLWELDLDVAVEALAALEELLTEAERRRAQRYRFDVHRRRFTVRRATLRRLLGRYLSLAPAKVPIEQTDLGKPFVRGAPFDFSASSSNECAVFAFSRARVGADVEEIRSMSDALGIAKRFFTRDEFEELEKVEPARQSEAFLHVWTVKEAVLKALGVGLTCSLRAFRVSGTPEAPVVIVDESASVPSQQWGLHRSSDHRRIIAVAVEGEWSGLRSFRWPAT